ncbi:A/G-specific adenine glycosylase [Desulfocastanea catecholica]
MKSVLSAADCPEIVQSLLQWFRIINRDLPWRRTYNPYHVWISEIMLQQTQMDRGVAYFLRWISRFSDVQAVATAEEQEILKYWEGLGYYARARNLHKAAKVIVGEFGGEVPCEYQRLLTLPGIGPYTAAAIASVAGNFDVPVIDANVARVYTRLFNIDTPVKEQKTQKRLSEIAENLLPKGQARAYNQALMDFGGLVCTPKKPHCAKCPVAASCRALHAGTVAERPLLGPKKNIITVHRVAGLIRWQEKVFIQQRKAGDVWGGLWEFPGGEIAAGEPGAQVVSEILQDTGLSVALVKPLTRVMHQYTHHKIILHCFLCTLEGEKTEPVLRSACNSRWIFLDQLNQFAFPAGPRKLIEYIRARQPELLAGDISL